MGARKIRSEVSQRGGIGGEARGNKGSCFSKSLFCSVFFFSPRSGLAQFLRVCVFYSPEREEKLSTMPHVSELKDHEPLASNYLKAVPEKTQFSTREGDLSMFVGGVVFKILHH